MTGLLSLLARILLGCLGAGATVLLPCFRRAYTWSDTGFRRVYLLAFAGIRLLLFATVFLLFRLAPRGDLPGIYIPEISSFLLGRVPYRNYATSYAPLFPYLYAPLYRLLPSPLTLILLSIAIEVAMASVFLRFMPRVISERQSRTAALLCLANPISLQFVAVDGQNNVLIGLFLALSLLWLTERRAVISGAALGLSIVIVKFLPLLFVPVFPLFLRKRVVAWLAGCAVVVAGVYGYFEVVLQAPVLLAVQREGEIKSAGGLPFLIEAVMGRDLGRWSWDALLLLALAGILGFGLRVSRAISSDARRALAATTFLMPALLLTVMALGKKTWPTYTEMVLFPLAMVVAGLSAGSGGARLRRGAVWLLGGFSLLSVTAHSVWASILSQATAGQVHALLGAGSPPAWLFLLLEVTLVSTYAVLTWFCLAQCKAQACRTAA